MPRPHAPVRRAALAAAVALLALVPAACGDDDDTESSSPSTPLDVDGAPVEAPVGEGVPEECGVYIGILSPADPAELSALPDGWPDTPGGSTLCSVDEQGGTVTVRYATSSTSDDVLAHYEKELGSAYELEHEAGTGDGLLVGYDDAIGFQVQPQDGGFRIVVTSV